MAELRPVARIDEIPPGGRKLVEVDDREIVLLDVGGKIHAIDMRCPHANGRLGDGRLIENGRRIECPMHRWKFDLLTGATIIDRRIRAKLYRVEIQDGAVLVEM